MKRVVNGVAIAAFALGSMSAAVAAPCTMSGMSHGSSTTTMMPRCTARTGPVVWYVPATKTYIVRGSAHAGMGSGTYVCRATAVARGGHMAAMTHASMHGSGSSMPIAKTMAPRPMPPGGAMPGNTPGPGLPNSTNAAPGSIGSPLPAGGNPASGNQGNTGAPGAGGQVPNNPASTSNSNPNPRPSPRP